MFDSVNTKQAEPEKECALSASRAWRRNKGTWPRWVTDSQSMWKDVFTSFPPKPCHSACVSTASAQLTKSISLHVCERVVRSVWVCEGEVRVSVCMQVRESLPRRDVPFPHINYWGVMTHWELRGGGHRSGDQDSNGLSGASVSLTPSTHTHVHTHIYCALTHSHTVGGQLIEHLWGGTWYFPPIFNQIKPILHWNNYSSQQDREASNSI